ncbi:MAG: hypothetical protein KY447_09970 [Actinobacteria bacterium]|nr:hypothetical protein [Actinomycetota bacterium]
MPFATITWAVVPPPSSDEQVPGDDLVRFVAVQLASKRSTSFSVLAGWWASLGAAGSSFPATTATLLTAERKVEGVNTLLRR